MKKRDFLRNIGLSSLGMAVMNTEALAAEMLDGPKPKPKAILPKGNMPKLNYLNMHLYFTFKGPSIFS